MFASSIWRKAVAGVAALALALPASTPVLAWKPKTHVYLAELAMRDAIDDGKVTLYQTDYASGRILGVLGHFEANPAIVSALREKPAQYIAGVVGPDAYPDIMTGQQIIHPGTNHSLLGSPSSNEPASAPGADAWLTHIWRQAYGGVEIQRTIRNLDTGLPLQSGGGSAEVRAFVAGFLTHAAGDMFMHTFVNHYTGGDFAIQPDPRNAIKHVVLEGYVGKRTPETRAATSIDGVEEFIYTQMIRADPGSVLEDRLLLGAGEATSVPAIFSSLRNGLQRDVERYDRERMQRRGPARVAYSTANGPAAEYKRAWIDDIDRGLRAWPKVSHELSLALIYNPERDGVDLERAKSIASKYVGDHLLSMAGAPDALVATAQFIGGVIDAVLPDFMLAPLEALKKELLNWLVKEAIGLSLDELKAYLENPETTFDRVMNAPGGGYDGRSPTLVSLAQFNRDVLKIDDTGFQRPDRKFDPDAFAPAFNTVQMTKLLFLSDRGLAELLTALRGKGLQVPDMPKVRYENAMLGFLTSMDGDNRWQGLARGSDHPEGHAFFLARGGADGWRNLFMRQIGERADWPENTAPEQPPLAPPDDTGFQPIDWWAVRLDEVKYDNDAGRTVAVTMTFRNDSGLPLGISSRVVQTIRPLLDVDRSGRVPLLRMEYVHEDEASLPQWHYPPHSLIPTKGRVTLRMVFDVGSSVRQREVHSLTIVEQRPDLTAGRVDTKDGASRTIELPRLNLDGSVGEQARPAEPAVVQDPARLQALAGRYRTNRGTILELKVENGELVGQAMTTLYPSPRESVKLTLREDGRVRGSMRDEQGAGRHVFYDLNLEFSADGARFSGLASYAHSTGNPPEAYSGERLVVVGTADPAAAGVYSSPGDLSGFKPAGRLHLRLESTSRPAGGPDTLAVHVSALNRQDSARSVQSSSFTPWLITDDGAERRWDGAFYGATASDPLRASLVIEPGKQARLTYVFPSVTNAQSPVQLQLRDGRTIVATFDIEPTNQPP